MNRKQIIDVIKQIVSSIENNIEYVENINDYSKITSFKDFIFSRIFDKISTLGINYIRTLLVLDTIKFNDSENLISNINLNKKYKEEADIEFITSILRPLYELYLELKSFKLSFTKLKENSNEGIEFLLHLVYLEDRFRNDEMKLSVSKDFYNCEPLHYKNQNEALRKEINDVRIKLTQKNISLLKSTKNKLLDVIKQNDKYEKILLGKDYLTSYAFLSKKTHFSYSNVIGSQMTSEYMLYWCLFLFISIYGDISEILKFKEKIINDFSDIFEILNHDLETEKLNTISIDNVVLFDFGIAKVIGKDNQSVVIEYIASNNFEKGTQDKIPNIFVQKEISENDFINIHKKYYDEPQNIYRDNKYEKMYMEIMGM